jgi:hypothetical protein
MRRSIHNNVLQRITANRQRIEHARLREEREAAALRALAASVPARVSDKGQRLDAAYSACIPSDKEEQKEQGTDGFLRSVSHLGRRS